MANWRQLRFEQMSTIKVRSPRPRPRSDLREGNTTLGEVYIMLSQAEVAEHKAKEVEMTKEEANGAVTNLRLYSADLEKIVEDICTQMAQDKTSLVEQKKE